MTMPKNLLESTLEPELFTIEAMEQIEQDSDMARMSLNLAIERGDVGKFAQLLDNEKIKTYISEQDVNLIVEQAAAQKKLEIIKETLKRYSLNPGSIECYEGITASATEGNLEIFQFLLDYFTNKDLNYLPRATISVVNGLAGAVLREQKGMIEYILEHRLIKNFGEVVEERVVFGHKLPKFGDEVPERVVFGHKIPKSFDLVFGTAIENNCLNSLQILIDSDYIENMDKNLSKILELAADELNVKAVKMIIAKIEEKKYPFVQAKIKSALAFALFRLLDKAMKPNINALVVCNTLLEKPAFLDEAIIKGVFSSIFYLGQDDETHRQEVYKKALQVVSKHIDLLKLLDILGNDNNYLDSSMKQYLLDVKTAALEQKNLNEAISLIDINKKLINKDSSKLKI